MKTLANIFISLATVVSRTAADSCYYPDGSLATDYTYAACTGASQSSCCIPGEGDKCLSNGLCYWPSGGYPFRGACTDQTWKSGNCTSYCNKSNTGSWEKLVQCGGTKYCCYSGGTSCCSTPSLVFDIGIPTVVNDFSGGSSVASPSAMEYTLLTASSSVATATASSGESKNGGAGGNNNNNNNNQGSRITTGAVIGIAAGLVTFLVFAIGAGVAYCCMKKQKSKPPPTMSTQNLIDLNSPNPPGSAGLSPVPRYDQKMGYSPQTPQWEAAPPYPKQEYFAPHHQQLIGPNGQVLIELQGPVARPVGGNGGNVHELA